MNTTEVDVMEDETPEDDTEERMIEAIETVNVLATAFEGFYPTERLHELGPTVLPCTRFAVSLTLQ